MDAEEIRITKGTQKFVMDISEFSKDKYEKVKTLLETLENQQNAEAQLEKNRGWRYMWQRTPKPYLVMMGYFVGFGGIGIAGYMNFSKAIGFEKLYLFSLIFIMIAPLILVGILTYFYIKKELKEEKTEAEQSDINTGV